MESVRREVGEGKQRKSYIWMYMMTDQTRVITVEVFSQRGEENDLFYKYAC